MYFVGELVLQRLPGLPGQPVREGPLEGEGLNRDFVLPEPVVNRPPSLGRIATHHWLEQYEQFAKEVIPHFRG